MTTQAFVDVSDFVAARRRITRLTCGERSSGSRCGRPAERVAEIPGLGHVVVCEQCSHFYARGLVRRLKLTRDAYIAVGNVLDQVEYTLEERAADARALHEVDRAKRY